MLGGVTVLARDVCGGSNLGAADEVEVRKRFVRIDVDEAGRA